MTQVKGKREAVLGPGVVHIDHPSQPANARVGKASAVARNHGGPDAARRAGDRGRHAQPMDSARRIEAYNRQKLIGELKRLPVEVIGP